MMTGILLLNLGTPENCDTPSVRCYLREFLNDPRVIDLPHIIRWALVNLLIVPFRAKQSAKAYQKIWTDQGSPLLVYSQAIRDAVAEQMSEGYQVELGMRYGSPSIASALAALKPCQKIHIFPLFPQYSSAATGSALEKVLSTVSTWKTVPNISLQRDFYHANFYIRVLGQHIKQHVMDQAIDMLVFSYHGLPQRQLDQSICHQLGCDQAGNCPQTDSSPQTCYRSSCFETSQILANELGLLEGQYTTAFQSRLGRVAWIKPYLDMVLSQLIQTGKKRIAVVCPSFVADCLETLEEIGIRAKADWCAMGGEHFLLIPALNQSSQWIEGLTGFLKEKDCCE